MQADNLGENAAPILITQSEFMRRYREMSAMGGGMNFYGELPQMYNIVVNVDNPHLCAMASERHLQSDPERPYSLVLPYGVEYQGFTVLPSDADHPYLRLSHPVHGMINTNLVGSYNADNVVAAIAVGAQFGVSMDEAIMAVEAYVPSNNRSQMTRTEKNVLIVDAYNANPSSMEVALKNLDSVVADRKVAMLGDMLELGEDSQKLHKEVVDRLMSMNLSLPICRAVIYLYISARRRPMPIAP